LAKYAFPPQLPLQLSSPTNSLLAVLSAASADAAWALAAAADGSALAAAADVALAEEALAAAADVALAEEALAAAADVALAEEALAAAAEDARQERALPDNAAHYSFRHHSVPSATCSATSPTWPHALPQKDDPQPLLTSLRNGLCEVGMKEKSSKYSKHTTLH
jgi:hypothetical protein